MKYEELLDIVKTGEGYTIELKESLGRNLGKAICAFANSSGGKIILGAKDDGTIVGYDLTNANASKIQDSAESALRDHDSANTVKLQTSTSCRGSHHRQYTARNMNPPFHVQLEQIKDLVVIYVPEGKERPYMINGQFYLRYGATSQQLNRDEIRDLFRKENLISFEKQKNLNVKDEDFSDEAFNDFRNKANLDDSLSKEHLLKNLNLLTDGTINNAGMLFFSKNVKYYYPNAIISCFLYADTGRIEIIDSKEFTDDLLSNLDNAYKYLISKLNTAIIIKGELRHRTKLELPKDALREAIINAMIHRDYFFPQNIQINISPDRVEIVNPGKLLFPKEELGKISAHRNPILVDLVHRLGFIEKAGSGINRMKKLMKEDDLKIEFEFGTYFSTIFHRPGSEAIRSKSEANPKQIRSKSEAERSKWILIKLKETGIMKAKDIEGFFSVHRDTAISDLNKLIDKGKIVKKGRGNNVWYELKGE